MTNKQQTNGNNSNLSDAINKRNGDFSYRPPRPNSDTKLPTKPVKK